MFLAFLLDYHNLTFIKAAVAPFGRLLNWFEGPNKSLVPAHCLVLTPERVPHSVVISHGTVLGGNGRSWSVLVFILDGQFPDAFPGDEDHVPVGGNPHPEQGQVNQANNVEPNWQHDLVGAAQGVQTDVGLNQAQMEAVHEVLFPPQLIANKGVNLNDNAAWE